MEEKPMTGEEVMKQLQDRKPLAPVPAPRDFSK